MQNESQNVEYKESLGRGLKKIAEEFDSIIVNEIWQN